ncbi:MAG: type VI secretion system contractile sheath small subunit [Alphaproteobacteria bacterium]
MAASVQHKLGRVRPPRVQITYDVEIGDAIEKRELPFIVGILADLAGQPETPLPKLSERRFVEIDRDNFDEVLHSTAPRLAFRVDDKLRDDSNEMLNILLSFRKMEDFDPVQVLKQVPALAELYAARQRLRDLLTKLDGNDELDELLREIAADTDRRASLKEDLGAAAPAAGDAPAGDDAGDAAQ